VRLARSNGFVPNTKAAGRDGFARCRESHLDTITFRFMSELRARSAALEAGEVHLVEIVDGPTAKRLYGHARYSIHRLPPFSTQVIKFNLALGATGDQDLPSRRDVGARHGRDLSDRLSGHPQLDGSWNALDSPIT